MTRFLAQALNAYQNEYTAPAARQMTMSQNLNRSPDMSGSDLQVLKSAPTSGSVFSEAENSNSCADGKPNFCAIMTSGNTFTRMLFRLTWSLYSSRRSAMDSSRAVILVFNCLNFSSVFGFG